MNFVQEDARTVEKVIYYSGYMLKAPAILCVAVVFLFFFLRLSFVIGIIIIIICIPGNFLVGEITKKYFSRTMDMKD